jgi:hypothetical protein
MMWAFQCVDLAFLLRENLDECSLASLAGLHGLSLGAIRTLNLKLRPSG